MDRLEDIDVSNVLWQMAPIDHLTRAEIYERFGRPLKVPLTEETGGLGELVAPMQVPLEVVGSSACLSEFGLTFRDGDRVDNTVQSPLPFCAPERLYGALPTFSSDMRAFATVFASLYLGTEAHWGAGKQCISRLVAIMGPFPKRWKGHSFWGNNVLDWWYDHSGKLEPPVMPLSTLESKIDYVRPDITATKRELVLPIIRRGWCYDQEQRLTAAQLLQDETFNTFMALYGQ